jgi:hypothetical protein
MSFPLSLLICLSMYHSLPVSSVSLFTCLFLYNFCMSFSSSLFSCLSLSHHLPVFLYYYLAVFPSVFTPCFITCLSFHLSLFINGLSLYQHTPVFPASLLICLSPYYYLPVFAFIITNLSYSQSIPTCLSPYHYLYSLSHYF